MDNFFNVMKHSSLLKQSVRYVLTMHHHEEKVTNKRTPKSISGGHDQGFIQAL